jgi:hypothetical protein
MKHYTLLQPFYDTRLQIRIRAGEIVSKVHDWYIYAHSDGIHVTRIPTDFVESNQALFELRNG